MISIRMNNLEAELKRNRISKADIAKLLNISIRTVHSRIAGETQWLYSECVMIRNHFFPDMDLGYLFPFLEE